MISNIIKAIIKNSLNIPATPGFITFFVTWACNARCVFCDIWKKRAADRETMSVDEIGRIFEQMKTVDVVRITGGEPFLRNDIVEIIERIDDFSAPGMIHISTNGLLTERILRDMKTVRPIHKIHIKISVDAVGEEHDRLRGVPGAYDKAMATVRGLVGLRGERAFHVGINQAIVDKRGIEAYRQLKEMMRPLGVPVYPSIAFDPANSLYSDKGMVDPALSFKPLGQFTAAELESFMRSVLADAKEVGDFKERLVDRYHLRGLYNRLVKGRPFPRPRCVALSNHLRILPNGDVPVCLYNGKIVGNLRSQKLKDIWFGDTLKKEREWVRKCPGCWQSCESAVSAIYTGDIVRGLFC